MAKVKTNEERLISFMTKHKISQVTLDNNCGVIKLKNGNLEYVKGYRYYTSIDYAYSKAFFIVTEDIEVINAFRRNRKKNYTTKFEYNDFDNKSKNRILNSIENKCYAYSDAEESGVKLYENGDIKGTIDQLRKYKSLTNNHFRYCRCAYYYVDENVKKMLNIASRYNLFAPYDSFSEYYTGSVVD